QGLCLDRPIVYRGIFGTGLFQCLYQPGPAHWAMLPSTLEWHGAAALLALAAVFWPLAWAGVGLMVLFSVLVALLQARQARLDAVHDSFFTRLLIASLC